MIESIPEQAPGIGQPGNLITVDELARYLQVDKSWIYSRTRVAKQIGFPVVRVGKYLRFNKQRVLEWLEAQRD